MLYTLSLHDALPIWLADADCEGVGVPRGLSFVPLRVTKYQGNPAAARASSNTERPRTTRIVRSPFGGGGWSERRDSPLKSTRSSALFDAGSSGSVTNAYWHRRARRRQRLDERSA